MKLVLVVASVVAALFAVGGFVQFFTASTDAAGGFRANLGLGYASASIGLLVLFCAAYAVLSRLDELLVDRAETEEATRAMPAAVPAWASATNPYESLTRYYFANNEPM